jgi:hypothetical protein
MAQIWDPWEISEIGFPSKGESSDKLRFLVNYAVLAPSSHNSQPWLFKIVDDSVELYADRARALPVVDPEDRELIMSCGAALFHLRLAFRNFGYAGEFQLFPEYTKPDLLARVGFGSEKKTSVEERRLFQAIVKRRTNRMPFESRPVPADLLSSLQRAAKEEGAWFVAAETDDTRNRIADLITEADRVQMADNRFRRELAAWVHQNRSASHDGMPGYAFGYGGIISSFAPLVVRTFDIGKGQAARDRQLATGSPALAAIGTENETPKDWLSAGQALAAVLLSARAADVWASFLNQPIEMPELRIKLRDILKAKGYPQLLLRMGYGQEVKPTPRRTAGEVLVRTVR